MTLRHQDHLEVVDHWLHSTTDGLSNDQLLQLFHRAIETLWQAARTNISAVMLSAVFERVLFNCSDRYPLVKSIQISEAGVKLEELQKKAASFTHNQLLSTFRCLFVELLCILGALTNEIISPLLHTELTKVKLVSKLKIRPRANRDKK